MHKRQYLLALVSFLAIPAVMLTEGVVFRLLDPELARGLGDYTRYYRLIETVQKGSMIGAAGLVLILWIATCFLMLRARQRSLGWLVLAAGGPIGFAGIAMLKDLAPAPGDLYQRFIGKLKIGWRVPLELVVFVVIWILAFEATVLKRELMIQYESVTTGIPVATIIERQSAESGMRAFGEGLEGMYLVVLLYLLWPIVFNLTSKVVKRRVTPTPESVR